LTIATPGRRDFPMAAIETLEITRHLQRTLRYREPLDGRTGTHYSSKPADELHERLMLRTGRWQAISKERCCSLVLRIRTGGTWLPSLHLSEREARKLLAGEVINVGGLRELAAYAYGHLYVIRLRDGGRFEETRVELPLSLLKAAFARALGLPSNQSVARLAVEERHRRFWRPYVQVHLHGAALATYRARYSMPADGSCEDLRGTLRWLARLGRGYSAHRNDPITVHLTPDGGDNFYFWLEDARGQRRAFNGGVVWHRDTSPAGGCYSVHT
jgi:hypothetical protein